MSGSEQENEHSSDNKEHIIDNFDTINTDGDPSLVTALTTPFLRNTARDTAATLRKIEARNKDIQHYTRQIQELDFAIAIQESYKLNIDHSDNLLQSSSGPNEVMDQLDAASLRDLQAREIDILKQEEEIKTLM